MRPVARRAMMGAEKQGPEQSWEQTARGRPRRSGCWLSTTSSRCARGSRPCSKPGPVSRSSVEPRAAPERSSSCGPGDRARSALADELRRQVQPDAECRGWGHLRRRCGLDRGGHSRPERGRGAAPRRRRKLCRFLTAGDVDGIDELYVASDRDDEIRRYVWRDGEPDRELLHRHTDGLNRFTWNLMPVPVDLAPRGGRGGGNEAR